MTAPLNLKKINETLTDDLIDKSAQLEKDKKDKRRHVRELSDIRTILATPEGRRFFWRLLAECGIYQEAYVHGDGGFGTTFNVGRKSIGLWFIHDLLAAKADALTQMTRENKGLQEQEEEFQDG